MTYLHILGLKGRLPRFIQNFLSNRSFNVRIGNTLSDIFEQEQSVPQGNILSPTLLGIKINTIVRNRLHEAVFGHTVSMSVRPDSGTSQASYSVVDRTPTPSPGPTPTKIFNDAVETGSFYWRVPFHFLSPTWSTSCLPTPWGTFH